MEDEVILVDDKDNEIGVEEKIRAHKEPPKLHRAFSIFIFNTQEQMLLQQRALNKYHSPGLWTNTCCSHPRPGETSEVAAHRRLAEEMGFDTVLKEAFTFTYKAPFDNGLTEWEFDHVFIGDHNGDIQPDPKEVEGFKWVDVEELQQDVKNRPEDYTPWFKIVLEQVLKHITSREE